ncbi:MAG: L-rhamnose mutarotase [Oscillospiraceae bacterium]|nr:L-rhamnose mutarotase [Oscillospiraceae bacterium]
MAWKGRIKPGMKSEYIRRHDNIWPEMTALFKDAGIQNYTIFCSGDELFGCFECAKGVAHAERTQAESAVVSRWNGYMNDVLELEIDPATGAQVKLDIVFRT